MVVVEEGEGICYVRVGEFFAFVAHEDNIDCVISQRKADGFEEDICVGKTGLAELKSVLVFDYEECAGHGVASLSSRWIKSVMVATSLSPKTSLIFRYISYQL